MCRGGGRAGGGGSDSLNIESIGEVSGTAVVEECAMQCDNKHALCPDFFLCPTSRKVEGSANKSIAAELSRSHRFAHDDRLHYAELSLSGCF